MLTLTKNPTKTHQQCSTSINACDGKTRHSLGQHRHHVRKSVPGQELVTSERLFGHRGKGRNGKALPKRKKTKWRNKIPKRKSVVGGLDALYARHRRKRPILPINRNQWKTDSNRNPYPNCKQ